MCFKNDLNMVSWHLAARRRPHLPAEDPEELEGSEVVEDLFTLDSGWSVEVLGKEDDEDLYKIDVRLTPSVVL